CLPAQTKKKNVVLAQQGPFHIRDHRFFITKNARKSIFLLLQFEDKIVTDLFVNALAPVAICFQLSERFYVLYFHFYFSSPDNYRDNSIQLLLRRTLVRLVILFCTSPRLASLDTPLQLSWRGDGVRSINRFSFPALKILKY